MLTMSMRPALKQSFINTQSNRLSLQQSHQIRLAMLRRRRALSVAIAGTDYEPRGQCPRCRYRLNHLEILQGFLPVVTDVTTKCPKCETRFKPVLFAKFGHGGRGEMGYLCPEQTVDGLKELSGFTPEQIEKESPAVFHSAIVNFGSLKAAFAKLGLDYKLEPPQDWKSKVTPFLGRLPDAVIARYCGKSTSSVRRLRVKKRIAAFVYRDVLDDDIQ